LLVGGLGPEVDPFILNCLALAEKKRAMISTRTKAALAAAKARGPLLSPENPNATLDTLAAPADDARHH
ncbi:MAG: resolvase, partial [Methyloceanibacter sp.]